MPQTKASQQDTRSRPPPPSLNVYLTVFMLGVLAGAFPFLLRTPAIPLSSPAPPSVRRGTASRQLGSPLQRFKHRNIFFDIGTNDGSSIEFFLNSSFQGGLTTQGGHDTSKLHGSGADGTWHIVAVEANPRFTPRLTKLKDELKELGKVQAFHLYNGTALTSYDGEITFFFDSPGGDAGASTMKDSFSVKENNNITVTALDVNTLFHSHMKVSVKDFVVVKIDIEGAEFEMMRRIISHSLLKYIDVIAVEWHDTNYWVYGQNETQRAYYSKKRECIQWILDESKNVVQDAWGRR